MASLPMGKIVILFLLLGSGSMMLFYWLRRMRRKKAKEQMENLRKHFTGDTGASTEPSEEDEKLLERTVSEIKSAYENGEEMVEISLDEKTELKIEAPDVLALETPDITLHKSFLQARLRQVEKTEKGFKIRLRTDQE